LPKAIMDGSSLTGIRTGAGGGLAADYLARPEAEVVGLFGAGVQARAQLQAVLAVRHIRQVKLISRSRASAETLAAEIATWPDPPAVSLAETPQQVVQAADIVIGATTAKTPLFDGHDLRLGTHITAVGTFTPEAREIDEVAVRRSYVVVDSYEMAKLEAGELIIPGIEPQAELGELVNGQKRGRQSAEEITLFKSVGVAVQDAAAAAAVLAAAEGQGLGQVVEL